MNKKLLRKKLALMLATLKKKRPYYCEVEYLESTGTQYIDTGFSIKQENTTVSLSFMPTVEWSTGVKNMGVAGSQTYNYSNWFSLSYKNIDYYIGSTPTIFSKQAIVNQINYAELSAVNGTSTLIFNGDVSTSSYSGTTISNSNIYLFDYSHGNSPSSPDMFIGRIYRANIKNGSTVVRDFIPVLDWDYVPCLYDKVSGQLFYNQGSGDFLYGREIHYVDYLESTGTQYIDTGVVAKSGLSSVLDFEYTALSGTASMLDARSGNDRFYLCHTGKPSTTFFFYYGYGSAVQSSTTPAVNTRYLVETSLASGSQSMKVNGTTIASGSSSWTYNLGVNLYLFGMNYSTPQYLTSAKLYGCKIMDGDTLVRDYKPAIDENGVGFMFDRVSHTCFLNQGTGAFKYTAREVEYLESTGTQYIDTGVIGKTGLSINVKVSSTTIEDSNLIGATLGVGGNYTRFFMTYYNYKLRIGYGSYTDPVSVSSGTTYDFKWEAIKNTQALYVDGTKVYTGTNTNTYNTGLTMYLFGRHSVYDGSETANKYCMTGKIYYCKIWDNGTLIRDFIPCYKDGTPGMYDKLNDVFYQNEGTGTFTCGRILEKEYE